MYTTQQSLEYKKFFQYLEKEEITRLQTLIKNTDLSKTSWKDDHLDRSHKKIVNYIFELGENRLESFYHNYAEDIDFCFLEPENVKTYDSYAVEYQDTLNRANNLSLEQEVKQLNKNQNKANISVYDTYNSYLRIIINIRVYDNKEQTKFTDEFIHFAYLMDRMENYEDPLLDEENLYEIEEMDRIEYFTDDMLDNYVNDIVEHIERIYPEKKETIEEILETKKKEENCLYFLLRDAVEYAQKQPSSDNMIEFYEDIEGCYSAAFEISASWYMCNILGCQQHPILPFYPQKECLKCGKKLE